MSLIRVLKDAVFGTKIRPDEIARLAIDVEAHDLFLSRLFDKGFIILGRPEEPSKIKDTDAIEFYFYEKNGIVIFPVFSSVDMAMAFIYNPDQESVQMCPYYEVAIDILLDNDYSKYRIVLNPKTPYRREITPQDILDLKELRRKRTQFDSGRHPWRPSKLGAARQR